MSLPDRELNPPDDPLYTCHYCGRNRLPEEDIMIDEHLRISVTTERQHYSYVLPNPVIREPIQCRKCAKEMGDV